MKILHLATDDKFIDHALPVFEKIYPDANDLIIFTLKIPLIYVKKNPDQIVITRGGFFNRRPKLEAGTYTGYDLVVFHSLNALLYPEVSNVPSCTPIIWLGWGFDYYSDLKSPLLLDKTEKLSRYLEPKKLRRKVANTLKFFVRALRIPTVRDRAIEKVSFFSPVLPNEYDLVANSRKWSHFPEFASWNYGTIEDDLIKGFEGESVSGNAILVGNSATFTGNHVEALDLLHHIGTDGRKVVAPLSYGNSEYAQKLTELGKSYFVTGFEPLMDFLPIEDYVAIIKKCGYVIMNHVRQQAVGNIVIMLYLGARVFVRQENPVYAFFQAMGVSLSTVQELEANPALLDTALTPEEREINRALVGDYWSRDRAYERTKKLVEKALFLAEAKKPEVMAGSYR